MTLLHQGGTCTQGPKHTSLSSYSWDPQVALENNVGHVDAKNFPSLYFRILFLLPYKTNDLKLEVGILLHCFRDRGRKTIQQMA